MTQDGVKALTDGELVQVAAWIENERKAREEKRKRETIAKIKELAQAAGVSVNIQGLRRRQKSDRSKNVT
jgi:sRNA-binding protein